MTCPESAEGTGGWAENPTGLERWLAGQDPAQGRENENLQSLRNFRPRWSLSEGTSLATGSQWQRKEVRPQPFLLTQLDTKDQEVDLKQKLPTQQQAWLLVSLPHRC